MLGVALAVAVVVGAGAGAGAVGAEADLSHHGHLLLQDGRLGVRLVSENHGPAPFSRATVRIAFSVPMAGGYELPPACLWSSDRVVSCRTGELPVGGRDGELALDLWTAGLPEELTAEISTPWRDGAVDPYPGNDRHRVLVLDTGDPYVF
ncbi:hypothetical protein ACFQ7A_07385 [Streptomyces sp. NPDC056528]|uniref:hypothetical protein n=1 Tax=Streptomyces sp. NPDC056528 TaxID=3345854 RepID=UPI0036C687E3